MGGEQEASVWLRCLMLWDAFLFDVFDGLD